MQRALQRLQLLGVVHALHVPALGREALQVALGVEGDGRRAVDRDAVVVVADDQLAEAEVSGYRRGLLGDALHQITV